MMFRMVISAPITGVIAVIKASQIAPSMTWIMGIAVAVLIVIIVVMFAVAIPKFQLVQKLIDKLNLVTRQNLTGLRVIRAFNTEKYEEEKFDKVNTDLTKVNLFVNRVLTFMQRDDAYFQLICKLQLSGLGHILLRQGSSDWG
jgi:ATP-binding cassette subfamily B protein